MHSLFKIFHSYTFSLPHLYSNTAPVLPPRLDPFIVITSYSLSAQLLHSQNLFSPQLYTYGIPFPPPSRKSHLFLFSTAPCSTSSLIVITLHPLNALLFIQFSLLTLNFTFYIIAESYRVLPCPKKHHKSCNCIEIQSSMRLCLNYYGLAVA